MVNSASTNTVASTPAGDTVDTMREVGAQVRRIRKRRNMTLQQLGAETGTSVSMLSMLERGVATPSISTLVAVASALGTHMSDLFGAGSEQRSPVHRLSDQMEVRTAHGVLRRLVHNDPSRGLEMVINEYEPDTRSGPEPSHHNGAEFGIVLSGTLTVQVDGVDHVLTAGDAIHYPSTTPHLITNTGHSKARAVWVNLDE
jgi:transcriptional regulator with XRE-family HTH domain